MMEIAVNAAASEAHAISKETSRRGREKFREEEAVKEKQKQSMAICSQTEPIEEVRPSQLLILLSLAVGPNRSGIPD